MQKVMVGWGVLISLSLLAGLGCSDDTTTPESATNNDDIRVVPETPEDPLPNTNNTDPDPDPEPATCDGCLLDGVCRTGLTSGACGIGGEECVVCAQNEVCSEDRECIQPSACNVMTCATGCCDSSGQCRPGDTMAACGGGGGFCAACSEASTCTNGRCQAPCGPDTCAGCCDASGVCQQGAGDAACGGGGGSCLDCAASNESCTNGQCVPPVSQTCAQTCNGCCVGETCVTQTSMTQCGASGDACVACGPSQTCNAGGMCEALSGAEWKVTIVSATISYYWDDFLSPVDAFVYADVEWPAGSYIWGETATKWDTNNPTWNEVVLTDIPTAAFASGLYFSMHNENAFTIGDICEWTLFPPANITPSLIESPCANDPTTILRWRIDPM